MPFMEAFLPLNWGIFWFAVSLPFVVSGIHRLIHLVNERRETLPPLAMAGAFIFVLLSLRMLSVTGRHSYPTGTGLETIIFGLCTLSVLSVIIRDESGIRIKVNLPDGDDV